MIQLGSLVQDHYNADIRGIAVIRKESLNGCVQYAVELAKMGKDDLPITFYLDEQRLDIVEEREPYYAPHATAKVGGEIQRA